MKTIVVNIRNSDYDIYCGRPPKWRKSSIENNPFERGNPFEIGKDGTREEVIQKFRVWAPEQPWFKEELEKMRGKRLGCFCKPKACHCDVYVEFLENDKFNSNI